MPRRPVRARRAPALVTLAALMAAGVAVGPVAARALMPGDPVAALEYTSGHTHSPTPTNALIRGRLARTSAVAAERRAVKRAADVSTRAEDGQWAPPQQMMVSAINTIVLPTGRVLVFGNDPRDDNGVPNSADAWTWSPADGSWKHVPPPVDPSTGLPANIWCAGHVFLPDGRLVVAGGNLRYPIGDRLPSAGNGWQGLRRVYTFNPFTERWTEQPQMQHGRWYPTLVTLPNGTVLILGGLDETGNETHNTQAELFTPSSAMDGVGTVQVKTSANRRVELYPHLFALPGDRVVMAGPGRGDTAMLNTTTFRWTDIPDLPKARVWGSAVIDPYDAASGPQTLTMVGGYAMWDPATTTSDPEVYRLNLRNPAAGFSSQPSMNQGRAHLNATFLADGTLMAVGGGAGESPQDGQYAGPVFTAELRRPDGTWREIPGQTQPRTYHSTAVTLPDGRLISAGDDRSGMIRPMEIYSPAYMSRPRPAIADAPWGIAYGTTFTVRTPQAASIRRVALMAPASTTHANDMGQRYVYLAFRATGPDTLQVTAPPSWGSVPSGYHMLLVVDQDDTPPVARWLRVGVPAPPVTPPPGNGGGATTGGTPPTPPGPTAPPPGGGGAPAGGSTTPPPVAPPGTVATTPATPPPPTAPPVKGPSPLRSVALVRPPRGRVTIVRSVVASAGTVTVRIQTPRSARQACRVTVRRPGTVTCRTTLRMAPGDRVTVLLRTKAGEWSRIVSPGRRGGR